MLERDVAIKFGLGAMTDESRLRFHVEARAVARLQHPNIVAVHHAGELCDQPFLVTEVLRGQSLEVLGRRRPEQVVSIGIDLSRALAAAHAAGVIHRDIKPANAFLCDDGTAKLLDFGLAQLREDARVVTLEEAVARGVAADSSGERAAIEAGLSPSGRPAGTPLFMAPETWRGEVATQATDIYSLGGLLFTLLVGHPPYTGQSRYELGIAVIEGRLPDLAAAAPDAPAALVDLVQRCLRVRPEARPSAEQVCHALQARAIPRDLAAGELDSPAVHGNPYRGLRAFGPEHRSVFFGREVETVAVLTELRGAPFVLVVGPSGAGKSSLVRAAVAPRVLAGALGRGAWRVASLTPGSRPVERLAQALASAVDTPEDAVLAELKLSPGWAAQRMEEMGAARCLLLVIDQFEEAWTLASTSDRAAFFQALAALAFVGPSVRLVATLRVDFLGQLDDLGEMRALALRAPVMLGPLSSEGLRRAIALPARQRGVEVDPAVIDALVDAARGAAGMLPLLEFALAELWDRRSEAEQRIAMSELEALGGLEGALARHADAAFARLGPRLRAEAKRILLALVTVEGTRAQRGERDLVDSGAEARATLEALVEARLVVATQGDEATAYELAHEVLIAGWPTLRGWLEEESAARELLERTGRAAAEWERLGRKPDLLWGARHRQELAQLSSHGRASSLEQAFVEASRAALRKRRAQRRAALVGIPLMLAFVVLAGWAAARSRTHLAVADALATARTLDAKAEEAAARAAKTRADAMAMFEKDDLVPAETLWKDALALEADTDRERREAGGALDRALARDPNEATARALYADITLRRLLAAERLHKASILGALHAQLGVYDDGTRAAWLHAPARVRVETEPPGATLTLARYREDAAGRLVETDPAPMTAAESRVLEPGSYLIVASKAGYSTTRYPFVVRRGEDSALRVLLPSAAAVPEGMIYVPGGRTQYGSADDEATR
ncbi:MAG: protein kinase domain-containing protein, partial [Polyangiaceae bacterium]